MSMASTLSHLEQASAARTRHTHRRNRRPVPDTTVSSDNKISLDAVFELNSRIANGENVSDIFDVTELIEVLGAILA